MLVYIILLAVVQGLTEFLSVSSSGHMVLLNRLLGIQNDFLFLSILLHVATLFSVLFCFRREIVGIIKNPFGKAGKLIIFASLPTVAIVILLRDSVMSTFSGNLLPFCFMLTACFIILTEVFSRRNCVKPIGGKVAFVMGLVQGIAVIPGISRSGSTICAGTFMGAEKKEVAKFSFLMSVPIIVGSMLFEIREYIKVGYSFSFNPYEILVGFLVSFIVGLFSIKFMLRFIEKSFIPFAIYLIFLSAFSFVLLYVF